MTNKSQPKLTLDRPTVYRVQVPGHLDSAWLDFGEMAVETGSYKTDMPITTLTGSLDQAALIGLLRQLYSLGLPLILVSRLEFE